jgi:hypothetical protein
MMKRALIGVALLVLASMPAAACELREEYVARLGHNDHYNSRGVRLTSAAAIIRQDRANFHQFGVRDPEDQGDRYFASKANRESLERMLERGSANQAALWAIVNDTPLIVVRICSSPGIDYIEVSIR